MGPEKSCILPMFARRIWISLLLYVPPRKYCKKAVQLYSEPSSSSLPPPHPPPPKKNK